jgi:hypothetical protein
MKQTLAIAAGALGLWLCSATVQATPAIDRSLALKTSAVESPGIVEQAHWRYRHHHRYLPLSAPSSLVGDGVASPGAPSRVPGRFILE